MADLNKDEKYLREIADSAVDYIDKLINKQELSL